LAVVCLKARNSPFWSFFAVPQQGALNPRGGGVGWVGVNFGGGLVVTLTGPGKLHRAAQERERRAARPPELGDYGALGDHEANLNPRSRDGRFPRAPASKEIVLYI